jgi:mannitol/fructose-specific phosphotransferase system IIA component (Ntr-type)
MEHAWLDPEAACSGLSFPLVDLPPAATASAEAAIRFLVADARDTGILTGVTAEAALRSALRREQLAPTAVGRGLALPHAKVEELPRLAGILGYAAAGVSRRPARKC